MYKRSKKIIIIILFISILTLGSIILLYNQNYLAKVGSVSDKYASEYFGEYIQWEYKMLDNNPDYNDLKILVDIEEKRLYLLNGNELIKKYPIASGKPSTPSPLGSWEIVNKARWGSGFGTRWMGLNVPWGRFGIHGTNKPDSIGYNASAGCIRMNNKDVEDLYKYVKHGTPVAIINGLHGPFGYGLKTIRPGSFGADVMEIQRRLQVLGYYDNDYLDGKYGPMMERALYDFQKYHGIDKNPNIEWETFRALGIIMMD
ncbi:Putative peptidoglycan binding domain-containing protein [Natronincola peptidivorans]|uniref:Putative peptidoglycan binding domain-containing protein n=1 Tax=Natronincola peptidivorans TaxID=426128 RepID=A0A1I0G2F1_9FIRM|nr:L,D-transpeptidase family protein [Natronincola peptidivorans]SET64040.1 Putative peptidoglycan binding domain-containing protein [Natronincola peptidivorans]